MKIKKSDTFEEYKKHKPIIRKYDSKHPICMVFTGENGFLVETYVSNKEITNSIKRCEKNKEYKKKKHLCKSPKWYNRIPVIRTWVKWFTKNY